MILSYPLFLFTGHSILLTFYTPRSIFPSLAGQDYSIVTEILEFLPGDTEKEVEIGILDDRFSEDIETFVLYLSSGAGAFLSPYAQAHVTLLDNDDRY